MSIFALKSVSNSFLQTMIDIAISLHDPWAIAFIAEKQRRIFDKNGEIND